MAATRLVDEADPSGSAQPSAAAFPLPGRLSRLARLLADALARRDPRHRKVEVGHERRVLANRTAQGDSDTVVVLVGDDEQERARPPALPDPYKDRTVRSERPDPTA